MDTLVISSFLTPLTRQTRIIDLWVYLLDLIITGKQSFLGATLLYDETIPSFRWLFETFLKAMGGEKPKTILTDQDAAMANAISSVMPKIFHGLCTWHIRQNALRHLNHLYQKSLQFRLDFEACIMF